MEITKGKKTALVFGSTGLVGSQVIKVLLKHKAYQKVVSFGRRPLGLEDEKLAHHLIDFDQLETYKHLMKGEDLFLCLGTTRAKAGSKEAFFKVDYTYPLQIAQLADARQVLLVSSTGASPSALFYYLVVKGKLEHAIAKIPLWGYRVFRPSMLDGEREEFRLGEVIGARLMRGADFLSGGKAIPKRLKLVSDEVVARAMVVAAQNLEPGLRIYENEQLNELASRMPDNNPTKT